MPPNPSSPPRPVVELPSRRLRIESGGGEVETVVLSRPAARYAACFREMTSVTNGGNLTGVRAVLSGVSGSLAPGFRGCRFRRRFDSLGGGFLTLPDPEKLTGGF